jgi:hypothetical protein
VIDVISDSVERLLSTGLGIAEEEEEENKLNEVKEGRRDEDRRGEESKDVRGARLG